MHAYTSLPGSDHEQGTSFPPPAAQSRQISIAVDTSSVEDQPRIERDGNRAILLRACAYFLLGFAIFAVVAQRFLLPQVPRTSTSMGAVETLLVFGDSYSDDCNGWRLGAPPEDAKKYPFPSCPPPRAPGPYDAGKWPELLARELGSDLLNFAYAGSVCSNGLISKDTPDPMTGGTQPLPAAEDQIESFHTMQKAFDRSKTVAIVFTGTNDIVQILAVKRTDSWHMNGTITVDDEARCIVDRVQQLYDHGLRRVILMSNVALELAPIFWHNKILLGWDQDGAAAQNIVAGLVAENNSRQRLFLSALQGKLTDARLDFFDTYALHMELYKNPIPTYGPYYNLNDTCYNCITGECHICQHPETYMWHDGLHPSQPTHAVIAKRLAAFIG